MATVRQDYANDILPNSRHYDNRFFASLKRFSGADANLRIANSMEPLSKTVNLLAIWGNYTLNKI